MRHVRLIGHEISDENQPAVSAKGGLLKLIFHVREKILLPAFLGKDGFSRWIMGLTDLLSGLRVKDFVTNTHPA